MKMATFWFQLFWAFWEILNDASCGRTPLFRHKKIILRRRVLTKPAKRDASAWLVQTVKGGIFATEDIPLSLTHVTGAWFMEKGESAPAWLALQISGEFQGCFEGQHVLGQIFGAKSFGSREPMAKAKETVKKVPKAQRWLVDDHETGRRFYGLWIKCFLHEKIFKQIWLAGFVDLLFASICCAFCQTVWNRSKLLAFVILSV